MSLIIAPGGKRTAGTGVKPAKVIIVGTQGTAAQSLVLEWEIHVVPP